MLCAADTGLAMTTVSAIDPALLLSAYAQGLFPMADGADDPSVHWVEPQIRAILPLGGFRLSHSLRKGIESDRFTVTTDTAFAETVALCAEAAPDRPTTWINGVIRASYAELFARGHAHSVECWQGSALVGGLYGVTLGRAFFGESMVSRARDASKVALAHLVARLRFGGWQLLDCQFITPHLASLGAVELPQRDYLKLLYSALAGGVGPLALRVRWALARHHRHHLLPVTGARSTAQAPLWSRLREPCARPPRRPESASCSF